MKKNLTLACLLLGLSLSACDEATGIAPQTTSTTDLQNQATSLSSAETGLVGNWKCIRGIDENTAYFLALNTDRSLVVTELIGTVPVSGARKQGSWKASGDTLALTSTSTGQTGDGTNWSTLPYQQIQRMLYRVSRDTLSAILGLDTLVMVRTDGTTPSISTLPVPVFSLGSGTYATSQVTTLRSTSPGALIRCTLDGSTPTSRSPLCSDSIRLDSSRTVKAMATQPGMANSPVVSALYVINKPTPRDTTPTTPDTVRSLADSLLGTWTSLLDGNVTTFTFLANDSAILYIVPETYDSESVSIKGRGLWKLNSDTVVMDISSLLYSYDGKTWTSSNDTGTIILGQVRVTANTATFLDEGVSYVLSRQAPSMVAARSAQVVSASWKRLQRLFPVRP